jgi:hypothetical protein
MLKYAQIDETRLILGTHVQVFWKQLLPKLVRLLKMIKGAKQNGKNNSVDIGAGLGSASACMALVSRKGKDS